MAGVATERGPQCTRAAQDFGVALLDVLATAHRAGFVHRDVKPNNVMVPVGEGASSTALHLIDFGLVANLERSVDHATWTRLTGTGFVVGTPPYMAPEQIEGAALTPQTDLWAVGMLLYWMVTGREPFLADTATLRMLKSLSDPLEPIATHAPHVSASFASVVYRALEKDPGRRWLDAEAMSSALATAETDEHPPPGRAAPSQATRTLVKKR